MNYDSIREKYPKVYKALTEWVQPHLIAFYNHIDEFPFAYQVGLLEEFFDEEGIKVKIIPALSSEGFLAAVIHSGLSEQVIHTWVPTRPEAQEPAYTRCFELLESKLP